ncbi:hypothetical protein A8C56_08800 [Niabella ginsenosidivorans]|uniref:Uncharacterized protein n=1 Tax=Niabella ginsenosidivorans TaxID=1176587 RepID=A0A1A9I3B9_9BACT|nr:hypothetical protein [Niabella ginsenosidivorans]ANH81064.1 hypothetical protein A8C56_08800 [Niabella ginsenosidivorans]
MKKQKTKTGGKASEEKKIFGDPVYPAKDDIYARAKKQPFKRKPDESPLSEGLDIPGSELDDDDERIGAEDEENNYYSLGGGEHNNLEEDNEEE